MTAPIALQLYTLRDALAQDFEGTIRRVAAMGYAGVEPFGLPENVRAAAALYQDLGLAVTSAHAPMPLGENQAKVLEVAEAYQLKRLILSGTDRWTSVEGVKRSCDRYNDAYCIAAASGLDYGIHNHWWEFLALDTGTGQTGFDILRAELAPEIFFEVDIYWAQVGGVDPAALVKDLGDRAPLLHIKDGPATREDPMLAVGEGKVDIAGVIRASAADWLIVELDRCATDMVEAVEKSCRYLVEKGLGHGR
jgi:sugar phosphate isomerase/epimerase